MADPQPILEVSYFPGCSLATTASESNRSLIRACGLMGLRLIDVEDWNCCGTSSAHSLDAELALGLAARTLVRADPARPLLTMCPSCHKNLLAAHHHLRRDPEAARPYERQWGGRFNPDLRIITFLEILHFLDKLRQMGSAPALEYKRNLTGLRVAPYYGCMSMLPPKLADTRLPFDLLNRHLAAMGAEVPLWAHRHRCCGTFLAATHPDLTTSLINRIMSGALEVEADCLVTACAMCQLNLEIRCNLSRRLPTFHFSELIALALGAQDYEGWFARHLVDPRPLLRDKGLIK